MNRKKKIQGSKNNRKQKIVDWLQNESDEKKLKEDVNFDQQGNPQSVTNSVYTYENLRNKITF